MISSGLEYDLVGIGSQLKSVHLTVPVYQRPYSWDDEHAIDFWIDLSSALNANASEYFLGTIVLTHDADGKRKTIIDGQQRMATTAMVYAAIRDSFRAQGDEKRATIVHNEYLASNELLSGEEVCRLRLGSDDDHFFRRRVIDATTVEPSRRSHRRILKAYDFLRDQVDEFAKAAGKDWAKQLLGLVGFLDSHARVIALTVASEADAFLIFETLNDRGADLTIADLLKNYLFGRAGSRLDTVRDGWLQAVGALDLTSENETFTMFLRHYWSSRKGTTRERELYVSIREAVTSEAQAVEFIDELQRSARFYAALLNSDHEHWGALGTESRRCVEAFLRLDMEQVRPLMLAAMKHFPAAEMRRLLRALVSWGVRGAIVGGIGGGVYERAYTEVALKIRSGDIKDAKAVFDKLSGVIASDDEFKTAFAIARVSRPRFGRYLLLSLEAAKRNQDEPELVPNDDEQAVNLEHVLPKNPDAKVWRRFNDEEMKENLHKVGNLALLQAGPNGRIGNKSFAEKKVVLAQSSFELTKEFAQEVDWTPAAVRARQERLAELALRTWPRGP